MLGLGIGYDPQTRDFRVADTNMLVSKNPCGPNATPYLPKATPYLPNATPSAGKWNKGRVRSPHVGARTGHVDFTLFVSISFALGSQHTRVLW